MLTMVPVELSERKLEAKALDTDMVQLWGESVELRSPGGPAQVGGMESNAGGGREEV